MALGSIPPSSSTTSSSEHPAQDLVTLAYDELRRLAAARLYLERPDHTLQPTALVHEVYLKLASQHVTWNNAGQFFAAAAEAMRRVLVDHARARGAKKRGGDRRRLPHESLQTIAECTPTEFLELNDEIERLSTERPEIGEVVKLRCFAGLSQLEIAQAMGISRQTADRYWTYAKLRLYQYYTRDLST